MPGHNSSHGSELELGLGLGRLRGSDCRGTGRPNTGSILVEAGAVQCCIWNTCKYFPQLQWVSKCKWTCKGSPAIKSALFTVAPYPVIDKLNFPLKKYSVSHWKNWGTTRPNIHRTKVCHKISGCGGRSICYFVKPIWTALFYSGALSSWLLLLKFKYVTCA